MQQKFQNVTNEHIKLWNKYFINAFQYTDFEGLEPNYKLNERFKIVSNEEIQKYEYSRVTVTKKFDDTISENIDIFTELIHTFKSINPDIQIYTVVIPKYIETEKNDEKYLSMHKKYFNKLVSQLQESYNFIHLDLKEMSDISYHRNYYYDAAHLNYYGAMAATDFINKIIFGDSLL